MQIVDIQPNTSKGGLLPFQKLLTMRRQRSIPATGAEACTVDAAPTAAVQHP